MGGMQNIWCALGLLLLILLVSLGLEWAWIRYMIWSGERALRQGDHREYKRRVDRVIQYINDR